MRAATNLPNLSDDRFMISIHAAHAGSDGAEKHAGQCLLKISIHAAHAGSDRMAGAAMKKTAMISIHAAHAGSDCITV